MHSNFSMQHKFGRALPHTTPPSPIPLWGHLCALPMPLATSACGIPLPNEPKKKYDGEKSNIFCSLLATGPKYPGCGTLLAALRHDLGTTRGNHPNVSQRES